VKLRVKPTAVKGHRVEDQLIPPGGVLPGEWERVPPSLAHVLEAVPEQLASSGPSTNTKFARSSFDFSQAPEFEPAAVMPVQASAPEPELDPEDEESEQPPKPRRGRPPGPGRWEKQR